MFIQTEATPNPATLKFLPGRVVLPESTFEARDAEAAARSPLAQRLFDVPGVAGVYFGHDFISVTKIENEHGWPQVKPAILGAIMEHFQSGAPVLAEGVVLGSDDAEEFYDAADHDTVVTIKDLLETRGARLRLPAMAATSRSVASRRAWSISNEGCLFRLPFLHRHAPAWGAEPVQALPSRSARGPGGLIAVASAQHPASFVASEGRPALTGRPFSS